MRPALAMLLAAVQWIHCAPVDAHDRFEIITSPPRGNELRVGAPVLPPLAHTRFCLQYPRDCRPSGTSSPQPVTLTDKRLAELESINRKVNKAIKPTPFVASPQADRWVIAPSSGDCADIAVTKRRELLMRGWPSHSLLLAEVASPRVEEHHLVLVIRTDAGDFVADSRTDRILIWWKTNYRWMRIQSRENPLYWKSCDAGH